MTHGGLSPPTPIYNRVYGFDSSLITMVRQRTRRRRRRRRRTQRGGLVGVALGGLGAAIAKSIAAAAASKAIPAAGKAIYNAYKRPSRASVKWQKEMREVDARRAKNFHMRRNRRFWGKRIPREVTLPAR
jgi:hypothetical protein